MRVFCIDPSYSCLGWAVVDHNQIEAHGVLRHPKDVTLVENDRTAAILQELRDLLTQYQPDIVLREEVVGSKSAAANRLLNTLKGGIWGLCLGMAIPQHTYTARQTKKHMTGKADATKNEMIAAVQGRYPELSEKKMLKAWREAVCDALALYIKYTDDAESGILFNKLETP